MAELILTNEEKAAALWSDLDDAALGKLVKNQIAFLSDSAAQLAGLAGDLSTEKDMKVGCEHPPTDEEALKFADKLERVIGEICNGKRKPQNIPMEPMCVLIQFVRDRAKPANSVSNS